MSSNAVTNSVVVVLKTLSLVVGGVVTYYSLKAARRTGQRPLRLFGLGFGVVTVGALLAGVSDQVLQFDRSGAMVIESGFTLAGFLVILYSLTIESDL